jgi:hypothetical protein
MIHHVGCRQVVLEEAGTRKVIFSTFDPDCATLLSLKQPRFPGDRYRLLLWLGGGGGSREGHGGVVYRPAPSSPYETGSLYLADHTPVMTVPEPLVMVPQKALAL